MQEKNRLFPLTLVAVFLLSLVPIQDGDAFMYLALGRRLLTLGELGATDPYLFAFPEFPWTVWHEWLSYVIFYSTHAVSGFYGLVVLRALLVSLIVTIVWKSGARFKLPQPVLMGAFAAACIAAAPRALALRSSLFSDLFTVIVVYLMTDPAFTAGGSRRKWLLPGLFLLWVQLHPGFPLGWVVLGLFALARFPSWSRSERKRWSTVLFLCLAAPALNPMGLKGALYPLEKLTSGEWSIYREINTEWIPTLLTDHYVGFKYRMFLLAFMAISLGITALAAKRGRRLSILLCLLLCYLGLSGARFLAVCGYGLGILVLTELGLMSWPEKINGRVANLASAAFSLSLILLSFRSEDVGLRLFYNGDPIDKRVPMNAVRKFKELPPGNIFNEHDLGGVLIWELDGRNKIAVDSFVDDPALLVKNYYRFSYTAQTWREIIMGGNVEYFLTYQSSLAESPEAGWTKELKAKWPVIYQDELAVIFQRPSVQ